MRSKGLSQAVRAKLYALPVGTEFCAGQYIYVCESYETTVFSMYQLLRRLVKSGEIRFSRSEKNTKGGKDIFWYKTVDVAPFVSTGPKRKRKQKVSMPEAGIWQGLLC